MRKNLESRLVEFSSAIIIFTKNLKEDNTRFEKGNGIDDEKRSD